MGGVGSTAGRAGTAASDRASPYQYSFTTTIVAVITEHIA
jgi:hypothetical protein